MTSRPITRVLQRSGTGVQRPRDRRDPFQDLSVIANVFHVDVIASSFEGELPPLRVKYIFTQDLTLSPELTAPLEYEEFQSLATPPEWVDYAPSSPLRYYDMDVHEQLTRTPIILKAMFDFENITLDDMLRWPDVPSAELWMVFGSPYACKHKLFEPREVLRKQYDSTAFAEQYTLACELMSVHPERSWQILPYASDLQKLKTFKDWLDGPQERHQPVPQGLTRYID